MTDVHLVKDESIGGIQREFIEVKSKKAVVGDYVVITEGHPSLVYTEVGEIVKITDVDGDTCDGMFHPHDIGEKGAVYHFQSRTIIPTNIIHIDGTKYRLDRRKAEVGEQIIIVNAEFAFDDYNNGDIMKVQSALDGIVYVEDYGEIKGEACNVIGDEEYRVLTPVKPTLDELLTQCTPENRHEEVWAEPTPDYTGIIANLAQRVTSLERITGELVRAKSSLESQLRDTQNNVQTFAEQTESNTKDIAFLDERTYVKPAKPTKSAEELLRDILRMVKENGGAGA